MALKQWSGEKAIRKAWPPRGDLSSKEWDIPMTMRLRDCLVHSNLTVEETARRSAEDLLKIKNFGEKSLRELDDILEVRGLPRHRPK